MQKKTKHKQNVIGSSPVWKFPTQEILISLAIMGITFAVFYPVLWSDFIELDDYLYVVENPNIQSGLGPEKIKWAFTTGEQAVWQPLVWISYMVDYQLYKLNPTGYHLTNLLFHLANTLLLFWVLFRMTGFVWRSALVALLFAIHPLHVESVAWIAERKDVLSAFFGFLTLWAYLVYVNKPSGKRLLLVMLAFILGLMAKAMFITMPFLLLLLDYWPLKRKKSFGSLVKEKIPLLVIAGAFTLITFWVHLSGQAIRNLDEIPFWARLENMFVSYASYLGKTFWPAGLGVYYPHPGTSLPLGKVVPAVLFLIGLSFIVVYVYRRYPFLTVGWFWYVITLLPVIGLIQFGSHGMADRFTYVSLVGIFIMVVWGVAEIIPLAEKRRRFLFLILPVGVILLILCVSARAQVNYWRTSVGLFERTIAVTTNNNAAHNLLAMSLLRERKINEAMSHLNMALKMSPDDAVTHLNLGYAFVLQEKLDEAILHWKEAVKLKPDLAQAYQNLACAFFNKGDCTQAWRYVHLAGKYGLNLPREFINVLAQKMPEPTELP